MGELVNNAIQNCADESVSCSSCVLYSLLQPWNAHPLLWTCRFFFDFEPCVSFVVIQNDMLYELPLLMDLKLHRI